MLRARGDRGVTRERTRRGAVEHPRELGERLAESCREAVHRYVHDVEVVLQRARRDADAHAPREACREPRDLLGDESSRPEREQQRARCRPSGGHLLEAPACGLQGVRQVTREASVVLARHHTVEPVLGGERGLHPQLVDDPGRGEVEVRVEPHRHRPTREGRHGRRDYRCGWSRVSVVRVSCSRTARASPASTSPGDA